MFNQSEFQNHYFRLQQRFPGQLRAQLKPLTSAIDIGENTVRNNGNIIRINGQEVRPAIVNGRLTYDLAEVAAALAVSSVSDEPVPLAHAPRGRPKKVGLDATAGCSA